MSKNNQQQAVRVIQDPTRFAAVMLGHYVWSKQCEILQSVATHARTAVKACHASGKTFTAAEAVLWWITRYTDGIAVTTAPTWTQVESLLWGEIRKAVIPPARGGTCRLTYPEPATTKLQLSEGRYALGLSTNKGVRFQGFHGRLLIVLDEAPGVMPEIYEAIEGIRAGGEVHVLALGNPTISSGAFYDAFTSKREGWNLFTIGAFQTPNLAGLTLEQLLELPDVELDNNPRPYLTTRRWVREKYREWGPEHPLWQSRVLGEFPTQDPYGLIPLSWVEQATLREVAPSDEALEAGIDVADGGENDTVLCVRQGPRILLLESWAKSDPRGEVAQALAPYKERLTAVKVDKIGVGTYFEKHFTDLGYRTIGINVGEAPRNSERFANLKAELYWGLRERFQSGDVSGPLDEKTIVQLTALRYELTARGQIAIESKERAERRGVQSPDRAEAVMLAFAKLPSSADAWLSFYGSEVARLQQQGGWR